ncbi:MAG: PIG-L family deacetylase [Pleurocapsa sp.]
MDLRKQLRARYRRQIAKIEPISQKELAASAIVFSPHPDDETLGCGGTIIRKLEAGAKLKLVFMSDGSRSHHRFIPEAELIKLRQQEALAAAEILGLTSEEVRFLNFPDEQLQYKAEKAITLVGELLQQFHPQQVFIPYLRETHPDHLATHQIVVAALENYSEEVAIYEYPVWYWHHFPWTHPWGDRALKLAYLKASIKAQGGWQVMREFNCLVDIESVQASKRLALAQHQTQTKPLVDTPDWGLLQEVADGEWLECFFQNQEIFRRTHRNNYD